MANAYSSLPILPSMMAMGMTDWGTASIIDCEATSLFYNTGISAMAAGQ